MTITWQASWPRIWHLPPAAGQAGHVEALHISVLLEPKAALLAGVGRVPIERVGLEEAGMYSKHHEGMGPHTMSYRFMS